MATLSRFAILIALAATLRAEDALPQRDAFDFEPSLKLYDALPAPSDVARATTNLERAKQKEQRWQQLQRAGVISQVEVERAARQAAEAALRLEQARVVHWKEQVGQQRARLAKGETSRDMVDTAERSLRNAEQLAAEAETFFKKRRLEIAQANLDRQQRLLALGAGSKAQVEQAAAAVGNLQSGGKE